MSYFDPSPNGSFNLPNEQGAPVDLEVARLTSEHAEAAQSVIAADWDATYVATGLMPLELRQGIVNPDDALKVEEQAAQIAAANRRLDENDPKATLFLGAFTSGQLLGLLRYEPLPGRLVKSNVQWRQKADRGTHGYIAGLDVLPAYSGRGIRRALADVAMVHAKAILHAITTVLVVPRATTEVGFYERHLGMELGGVTNLADEVRRAPLMRRQLMSERTAYVHRTLRSGNQWLIADR